MSAPLLEVTGLRAGFGPTTVLHGVDLAVAADRMSTLLGLNGAGKSVSLKVIGGLVPAWGGEVRLDGEDITRLSVEQRVARGMAFVPQGRQLFAELTVAENLRLGAYLPRRRDRAASDAQLAAVLERFPKLAERRDQPAGTMSGGEQAVLALARALMGRPKLLLVDEPSAGLSPVAAAQVFELLREVHRDGVAVLLVEQNVHLALSVADRAHVMQRGRVAYEADVAEIDHARLARELGIGRLLTEAVSGAAPGGQRGGAAAADGSAPPRARARRRVRVGTGER